MRRRRSADIWIVGLGRKGEEGREINMGGREVERGRRG